MTAYVVIERQHSPDLAILYPGQAAADWALEHSFFIAGLCEENCLDAYTISEVFDGIEIVIPPEDDLEHPRSH